MDVQCCSTWSHAAPAPARLCAVPRVPAVAACWPCRKSSCLQLQTGASVVSPCFKTGQRSLRTFLLQRGRLWRSVLALALLCFVFPVVLFPPSSGRVCWAVPVRLPWRAPCCWEESTGINAELTGGTAAL